MSLSAVKPTGDAPHHHKKNTGTTNSLQKMSIIEREPSHPAQSHILPTGSTTPQTRKTHETISDSCQEPSPGFFFFGLKEMREPVKGSQHLKTQTLTSREGLGESHRAQTGCHLQQRQESGARAENLRKLSPRCKPSSFSNGAAKREPQTLA